MSFLFIYLSDLIIQFRNENITTIISDYSPTLINAYYLRNDIELLSYMYRLYEKYSVDLGLNISILEKLFNEGVIKRIEIYL